MATRGCTGFEIESAWVGDHDESHGGRITFYCAFWYERACSSYESPGAVTCQYWTTYVLDLHLPPHPPTPHHHAGACFVSAVGVSAALLRIWCFETRDTSRATGLAALAAKLDMGISSQGLLGHLHADPVGAA